MYNPPAYVWALTIGGPTAIAAATCIALYSGAVRAGQGRKRAALLGGSAAVLLGGWFTATAVIAGHGWYDTRPSQMPWLPIAAAGSLGMLLALSRIPVVARADSPRHGQPPRAAARVPGDRGVLPALPGPRPPARAVRPARRPRRHCRRYRRATGRAQARPGDRPPRRRVVQRLRPHRPGRGHNPRHPHQLRAAPRHPFHRPDQPAPAGTPSCCSASPATPTPLTGTPLRCPMTWPAPGCSPSTATATPNSPTPAPAPPMTLSTICSPAPCPRREPSAGKTAHHSASSLHARTAPV